MIETLSPRRARGRAWIHATAGVVRAGHSLTEWGHVTPRFPQGITNQALAMATPEIQRETALCWYHMNLSLFDPLVGGPYFGFAGDDGTMAPNTAGVDLGVWAPRTYDALSVLTAEFGGILPDALIAEVADGLPGQWEWPDLPSRDQPSPDELQAVILAELSHLREEVASLQAGYTGNKHNNPPPDDNGTAEPQKAITDLEAEVRASQPDGKIIQEKWEKVAGWVRSIGNELLKGVFKAAGGDLYKALNIWETTCHIGSLITAWIGFL